MRKVTASAVILTAITGCSQNQVPSAEWSFDAPPVDTLQASTEETSQSDLSAQLLSSASSSSRTGRTTLPGQAVSGLADDGNMGPAFEQPLETPESNVSGQSATDTGSATAASSNAVSSRPDPIAHVRAYLNSTRSPGLLSNRVPYSSQVYLPTAPTYTPAASTYQQTAPLLLSPPVSTQNSPLAVESLNPPTAGFSATQQFSPTADASTGLATPSGFQPSRAFSLTRDLATESVTPVLQASTPRQTVEPTQSFLPQPSQLDGLPVLAPAQLSGSRVDAVPVDVVPVETVPAETAAHRENTPIGTAILADLQRRAGLTTEGYAPDDLASDELASDELASENLITFEIEDSTGVSVAIEYAEPADAIEYYAEPAETTIATEPAEPGNQPTLASLIESLPQRAASPLSTELQANPAASQDVSPTEFTPEAFSERPDFEVIDFEVIDFEAIDFEAIESETTTGETQTHSPLLEGLAATAPLEPTVTPQTLYRPIPTADSSTDVSASLVREAIVALGNEASTVESRLIRFNPLQSSGLQPATFGLEISPPATEQASTQALKANRGGAFSVRMISDQQTDKYRQRIVWQ